MRISIPKGADHPLAKFTPQQVDALRQRFDQSPPPSIRQVARETGVSRDTVTRIKERISYQK